MRRVESLTRHHPSRSSIHSSRPSYPSKFQCFGGAESHRGSFLLLGLALGVVAALLVVAGGGLVGGALGAGGEARGGHVAAGLGLFLLVNLMVGLGAVGGGCLPGWERWCCCFQI
jgi:hypothetical protein